MNDVFSSSMNRRILFCAFLFIAFSVQLSAQDDNSFGSNEFTGFREELLEDYNDFRREINAEYIDFLTKAWKEYRLFQGKVPDETPKPLSPVLFQEEKNMRDEAVKVDGILEKIPDSMPVRRGGQKEEDSDNCWLGQTNDSLRLDFFGAELAIHYQRRQFSLSGITERSVGNLWKDITDSRFTTLLKDMLHHKRKMQMNDWAYFLLAKKVAARLSSLQSKDCRMVFQHFLLVQSGYDVRLGRVDNFLVLLLPVREEVYACPYLELDGKLFYVISDEDKKMKGHSSIFTYRLPDKLVQAPYLSLMIHKELLLPVLPKSFCVKAAEMEIKGEVNQNEIRFYKEYPSCELAVYARAAVTDKLGKQLKAALSAHLSGKPFAEALNRLLLWVQAGFRYQTDGEQFGYEKPFFMAENFYYPASDCEDRSILFAWLVRHLLGREVVLLDYPGHMATAVSVGKDQIRGAYVELNGKKYVVCDPTYVNAEAGRMMPSYRTKRAKVIRL